MQKQTQDLKPIKIDIDALEKTVKAESLNTDGYSDFFQMCGTQAINVVNSMIGAADNPDTKAGLQRMIPEIERVRDLKQSDLYKRLTARFNNVDSVLMHNPPDFEKPLTGEPFTLLIFSGLLTELEDILNIIDAEEKKSGNEFPYTQFEDLFYSHGNKSRLYDEYSLKVLSKPGNSSKAKRTPLGQLKTIGLMHDKTNYALLTNNATGRYTIDGQMSFVYDVNHANEKHPDVVTYISLTPDNIPDNAKIAKKIDYYDMLIMNIIGSQLHAQKNISPLYITSDEIWRLMNGIKDPKKIPSKKQSESINNRVLKMSNTRLYMNINDELERNYISIDDDRIINGEINTHVLNAECVSFITERGRRVNGYEIFKTPFLYSYNEAKKHLFYVDFGLLDTSDMTGNEGDTPIIRSYLLQRIEQMYLDNSVSTKIKYSTMYSYTGIKSPEEKINRENYSNKNTYKTRIRQERQKINDKVKNILESWKMKSYISGYRNPKKNKHEITDEIIIILNKSKKDK